MTTTRSVYTLMKRALVTLGNPLFVDDVDEQFTLSIPEAQTTTVDSVQGWQNRPTAVLRCPGCDGHMIQPNPIEGIDCTDCYRSFDEHEFSHFELLALVCPRCDTDMHHGIRHPNVFDVPEYATCPDCQYHWDLDHWF